MASHCASDTAEASLLARLRAAVDQGVVAEIALWNPGTIGGFTISGVSSAGLNYSKEPQHVYVWSPVQIDAWVSSYLQGLLRFPSLTRFMALLRRAGFQVQSGSQGRTLCCTNVHFTQNASTLAPAPPPPGSAVRRAAAAAGHASPRAARGLAGAVRDDEEQRSNLVFPSSGRCVAGTFHNGEP